MNTPAKNEVSKCALIPDFKMNGFLTNLCCWIEINLEKKLSLDDISARSGYSKWYLQRLFREATGTPLASYVRERKLSRAAVLLKLTHVSVINIAYALGFSTQQTFTRTFTKHFGIAPGRYRAIPFWHFKGLRADLRSEVSPLPVPTLVSKAPMPAGG